MAQPKDPAIKLFGRKIGVPNTQMPATSLSKVTPFLVSSRDGCFEERNKSTATAEVDKDQPDNGGSDQENVLKKPDKIIPCPRCNSLETKFCYFNNYNVNQPRHFCRNCQRYWTAGGTMRNVPVGAGRRKNKHLPSQFRELLASSDGIPVTSVEHSDPATHQLVTPADATRVGDQQRYVDASSVGLYDNVEEPSSSESSITAGSNRANEAPEDATRQQNVSLLTSSEDQYSQHLHPMQLHSLTSIVFPWNPGWNNSAAVAVSKCSTEQAPAPVLAVQGFSPPSIPVHFIPASHWGCVPVWSAGTGNMSLVRSNGCLSPSSSTSVSGCTGNGSTLGKHYRDSNLSEEEKPEKCLFAPKTQRLGHSNEASKTPFWDALGLKRAWEGPCI